MAVGTPGRAAQAAKARAAAPVPPARAAGRAARGRGGENRVRGGERDFRRGPAARFTKLLHCHEGGWGKLTFKHRLAAPAGRRVIACPDADNNLAGERYAQAVTEMGPKNTARRRLTFVGAAAVRYWGMD